MMGELFEKNTGFFRRLLFPKKLVSKRYYFIFEGVHTEMKYFEGLFRYRSILGIHPQIELVILQKRGDYSGHSHPKKLFALVEAKKKQLMEEERFDPHRDRFVLVFDRDSYDNENEYEWFLSLTHKEYVLAVTNPCFEIWLLLHYQGAVENFIRPNEKDILENKKVSNNHTYTSELFSKVSNMNSKNNLNFKILMDGIDLAIEQEKQLEQQPQQLKNKIGSNIGWLISLLREDPSI